LLHNKFSLLFFGFSFSITYLFHHLNFYFLVKVKFKIKLFFQFKYFVKNLRWIVLNQFRNFSIKRMHISLIFIGPKRRRKFLIIRKF